MLSQSIHYVQKQSRIQLFEYLRVVVGFGNSNQAVLDR